MRNERGFLLRLHWSLMCVDFYSVIIGSVRTCDWSSLFFLCFCPAFPTHSSPHIPWANDLPRWPSAPRRVLWGLQPPVSRCPFHPSCFPKLLKGKGPPETLATCPIFPADATALASVWLLARLIALTCRACCLFAILGEKSWDQLHTNEMCKIWINFFFGLGTCL